MRMIKKMPNYIMTFGKYSGQDISMVPRGYVIWMQENIVEGEKGWMTNEDREELGEAIEEELAQRDRSHVDW